MSLFFNTKIHTVRVVMANGKMIGLPPRLEVWIDDADISYDMQVLVNKRVIINRGGKSSMKVDPFELPDELKIQGKPEVIHEELADGSTVSEASGEILTSSDLQLNYDKYLGNQDETMSAVMDELDDSLDGPTVKKRGRKKKPLLGD